MKERPILFSTPMVRAILDGSKTVTRRVVDIDPELSKDVTKWGYSIFTPVGCISGRTIQKTETGRRYGEKWVKLKYGKQGDILWVRETWSKIHYEGVDEKPSYFYKADGMQDISRVWKPSIHMPKDACRLKLKIVSIRVERLHDITEEDAKKEGAKFWVHGHGYVTQSEIAADPGYLNFGDYRTGFQILWASINGQDSWDSNPWVWRIEFTKL